MQYNNHTITLQDESFNVWTGSRTENDPLKNELILADDVPTNPIRCAKCDGTTISVEGYYRLAFTIEQADGSVPKEKLDDEGVKVVEVMICPSCQIRWYIADAVAYRLYEKSQELYTENHELRVELAIKNCMLRTPRRTMGERN
jgi:hypothetical protein